MDPIKTTAGDDLRLAFDAGPLTDRLLSSTAADVWAAEFVKLHGGDEGLMRTWFANAIEAGRDAGTAHAASRMTAVANALEGTRVEVDGRQLGLRPLRK